VVKRVTFAVPGDLATLTGGFAYDRRIISELEQLGWAVDVVNLGEGYPRPSAARKAVALELLGAVPADRPLVVDGLAFGVLPEAARDLRERALIALVHHPLALETGLSAEATEALYKSERDALSMVRGVVVTSPSTGTLLTDDYEVPSEIITVVRPGTDPGTFAPGSQDATVRLLSVGSIVPRKGFDVLIEALSTLTSLPWRLTIAGDDSRDAKATADLKSAVADSGLAARVELLGAVAPERLTALYTQADLFVLASRFEGYGMVYAEALAHGLPVIGTTAGAIPDTVPPGAGVLVEPNDIKALSRTLRMLIENRKEREWLADGARKAAADLPTWPDSAALFAAAIEAAETPAR
jgi:glycosyltransferase involved in cell wall biosynthesis